MKVSSQFQKIVFVIFLILFLIISTSNIFGIDYLNWKVHFINPLLVILMGQSALGEGHYLFPFTERLIITLELIWVGVVVKGVVGWFRSSDKNQQWLRPGLVLTIFIHSFYLANRVGNQLLTTYLEIPNTPRTGFFNMMGLLQLLLIITSVILLYSLSVKQPEGVKNPSVKWLRPVHRFTDYLIIGVMSMVFAFRFFNYLHYLEYKGEELNAELIKPWLSVFFVIPFLIAFVISESVSGKSPAKEITGTRVVDLEGGTASWGRILLRSLARFIPFDMFSFLGKRGWHDAVSGTEVTLERDHNPIIRMCDVIILLCRIGVALVIWSVISFILVFALDLPWKNDNVYMGFSGLLLLLLIFYLIISVASLMSFTFDSSKQGNKFIKRNTYSYFLEALFMWLIPFIIPNVIYRHTMDFLNLTQNEEIKDRLELKRKGNRVGYQMIISWFLLVFLIIAFVVDSNLRNLGSLSCFWAASTLLITRPMLKYFKRIRSITVESNLNFNQDEETLLAEQKVLKNEE